MKSRVCILNSLTPSTRIKVGIISVIGVAAVAVSLAVAAENESLTNHLAHASGPQSLPLLAVAATPQDFHVEGVLEYDSVEAGNRLSSLTRRAFTVDVAASRWRIGSRELATAANSGDARLYIELTAA